MVEWYKLALSHGLPISEINVGGGLGIKYTEADDPQTEKGDRGRFGNRWNGGGEFVLLLGFPVARQRDRLDRIAAAGAESAAAVAAFRAAMDIAEEFGMRPLLAHCHLGIGQLHKRAGEQEAARTHLATALRLYRDMDMRHWLPQAEAAAEGYASPAATV